VKGSDGFEFPIQARVGVSPAGTAGGHSFALAFEVKSSQGKRITQGFSSVTLVPGMTVDLGTWGHHDDAPGDYELTVILTVMTPDSKSFDLVRHTSKYVVYADSEGSTEKTGRLPTGPTATNPYDLIGRPANPRGSGFGGYQFAFNPGATLGAGRGFPAQRGVVVQPQITPGRVNFPLTPARPNVPISSPAPPVWQPSGILLPVPPGKTTGGPPISNLDFRGTPSPGTLSQGSGGYLGGGFTFPTNVQSPPTQVAGGSIWNRWRTKWNPLNKAGLEAHARGRGIKGIGSDPEAQKGSFQNQVGAAFEQLGVDLLGLHKNTDPFPGYERFGLGKGLAVVPDAVGSLLGVQVDIDLATGRRTESIVPVPNSVFYEFKATSDTIGWLYNDGQIAGYVDVLSESDAYKYDVLPQLVLVTPADAKIAPSLIDEATKRKVMVIQIKIEEMDGAGRDGVNLRFGEPQLVNPKVLPPGAVFDPATASKPGTLPLTVGKQK
jgi:hypothetical protein